jgi:hypothetical protein
MKQLRFDIKDLVVENRVKNSENYTYVSGMLLVRSSYKEDYRVVHRIKFRSDGGVSGYNNLGGELSGVEFEYATIYLRLFYSVLSNIDVTNGIKFHYKNYVWMNDLVNEMLMISIDANKMGLL